MYWLALLVNIALGSQSAPPDTQPRDARVNAPVTAPSERTAQGNSVAEFTQPGQGTSEIKRAVNDYVKAQKSKGVVNLPVIDNGNRRTLALKFDSIQEPVMKVSDNSYLACASFKSAEKDRASGKRSTYDIDFWLSPDANGRMAVNPERTEVHSQDGKRRHDYKSDGSKVPLAE